MRTLSTIGEARALVLDGRRPLHPIDVELDAALGLVLAEDIVVDQDVPPHENSAMDGFAVRWRDTQTAPVTLRVIDTALAGRPSNVELGEGEAIRIMTGAVLPSGADAICVLEETRPGSEPATVVIDAKLSPGQHVRRAGEDLRHGDVALSEGVELGPAHLGILASLGRTSVSVHPRPRVGVLSTGDELVEGSVALGPGQIRDSNRHLLLAAVRSSGFQGVDLGIVPDDRELIRASLQRAVNVCDAVLTSGGVSVGDADLVKEVLAEECGGTMRWLEIAVKPAKPLAFGELATRATPIFGLPGNPVSALVSFELFARPALRRMAGHRTLTRPTVLAVAEESFERSVDGKIHLVSARARVARDGLVHVRSAGTQASHVLSTSAGANALVVLADGHGVAAGDRVEAVITDGAQLGGRSEVLMGLVRSDA